MAEHSDASAERTLICGRPVEAFNQQGDSTMVELRCERIGPPARPVSWSGTTFVSTLSYVDPGTAGDAIDTQHAERVVIEREANSLWDSLQSARADLDVHGWYLPIAAARVDSWCVYAERRPEVGVVHRIGDMSVHEGILTPAPREMIGTVDAQRASYQQWLAEQTPPQEMP